MTDTASQPATLEEIQNFGGKYPKQLWYLFFSEMWERFCFYGMRGMLTYFMVTQLFFKDDAAQLQYGAIQAFVYAFTFVGGLFADKILGFRRSLFWGGLLMIVGSCILAYDPKAYFFLGISFTVVGTGFFKPNISTMVGQLYKSGDYRRDAGFSLFYSGINLGALLGGYLCIAIGKSNHPWSWNLAFGLAAVVMTISLITFVFTKRSLGPIGLSPFESRQLETDNRDTSSEQKWKPLLVFIGSLAVIPVIMKMVSKTEYTDYFMYTIGPLTLLYLFYEMTQFSKAEVRKLWAALIFIIFSIIFWAFFEQAGGSLSLFAARNLDNKLLGLIPVDPNGVNNSANSLFVIIFAPIIGLIWLSLSKKRKEPNTVVKFGLGFIFLAIGYWVFFATRFFANAQGIANLDVFTFAYFFVTLGELCLSPIGLSIMTKLSPHRLQGVMMGTWFLASAYGQYVAGIIGAGMAQSNEHYTVFQQLIDYTSGYKQLAIYAFISGVVLIILSPAIRKLMQEVK
ncbi:peptide MFS transporter [Pedobacter sp. BS3]|uniref:peptide MFS transporter n=1 Tax=Pedobacter sp. BS3 TaxID=2567937 RepID=UPI0011EF3247|nr:peptide MFS transporter [Pedobacter sp. BS3]TZF81508.1 peptide MFS transporter [Pedobacter sp. BS3]